MLKIKDQAMTKANPVEGESTRSLLDRYLAAQKAMTPEQRVELAREVAALSAEDQGPPGP